MSRHRLLPFNQINTVIVTDGTDASTVADRAVHRIYKINTHRLVVLVDAVFDSADADRLDRLAGCERDQRKALTWVITQRCRAPRRVDLRRHRHVLGRRFTQPDRISKRIALFDRGVADCDRWSDRGSNLCDPKVVVRLCG